jgi:asparagine synthase (glutamine-hydrolysing)
VAFASEAKAVLAAFPEERRSDRAMVRDFIVGAVPDADEHTFFENVRSVLPGHWLSIESAREVTRQHWDFQPGSEMSRPDAPQALQQLLTDAVKLRLRSDVPVGVMLSGGLDSSSIARIAAHESPRPLHCFSLQYANPALDESAYVRLVADDPARYQLHWVTPSAANLMATIGDLVWHHDAPTAIRGRYPHWHVLREASRHVTVVLGGQGADELLAGYERFILPYALDRLDPRLRAGPSLGNLLRELIQLGRVSTGIHRVLPRLILGALSRRWSLPDGSHSALARSGRVADQPVQRHRMVGDWGAPDAERPYQSRLNNALWSELRHAGLPEILHSEDAISMAFSLESRLPFLDHRIVELCFSLAYSDKMGEGWTKLLLRQATAGLLPDAVRLRRHKQGFPGDYAGWLAQGAGLQAVRELMLDRVTLERGWLDPLWLKRRLGGRAPKAARWARRHLSQLWQLLTLEMWSRQFLDGDHTPRRGDAWP